MKLIIERFDKQIKREMTDFNLKNKKECPSYWKKELFLLTRNMDINDWSKIRDENYWVKRDSLKEGIDRDKFIYKTIISK